MKKTQQEIFDIKYDWDNDKWELIVYIKSLVLMKNDVYKKIFDDEESVEKEKKSLLSKLSTLQNGNVEKAIIEFGMTKVKKNEQ